MNLDDGSYVNNILCKEPFENPNISHLVSHLSPYQKSKFKIQYTKGYQLSSSTSRKNRKDNKVKRKGRMKSIKEIVDNESTKDAEDDEFKRKYIIKNSKWKNS